MINFIFQDWAINKGNFRGRIYTLLFRVANYASYNPLYKFFMYPYLIVYKILTEFIFSFEIPYDTKIGSNLQINHGFAIVVNRKTIIGDFFVIRHSTTIGNNGLNNSCPIIGNNVNLGAHSCIIGNVIIGDNVIIGAGTIITKNVSSNTIAYGSPVIQKPITILHNTTN